MLLKFRDWLFGASMVICLSFFLILSLWWFSISYRGLKDTVENNTFTLIYPFMSLIGGVIGLFISKKWGGLKSYLGSALTFFSLGLIAQFFGQAVYAYLIYIKNIEVPYPSLGDLGYFGSIIFYVLGLLRIGKVIGLKRKLLSFGIKFFSILLPLLLLLGSYIFFLRSYAFDWSSPIKVILDFCYPLGQAFYLSLALLSLILTRNILGGVMKKPIFFLLFTLVIQYFCDFMFLYQANKGEWYVGGINDYLYFCSYFCMTIAIIYIGNIFMKIQKS